MVMAVCFTGFFILEYKNSLEISDGSRAMQSIEQMTDLAQLKRTAKMNIDFLNNAHKSALSLWRVSVVYGAFNMVVLSYCLFPLNGSKKERVIV